ncbi:MAG: hypothetical protein PWP51_1624, partial [Clostridiales bacterium]|nr:hypothetical protein [Clostridiales bacterium]MDN5299071.1 hypothetical protein [Clostridiales bacterium]
KAVFDVRQKSYLTPFSKRVFSGRKYGFEKRFLTPGKNLTLRPFQKEYFLKENMGLKSGF